MSRRRGRVFSYLAAYVSGLVLGLVCHISDSSVAGNQLFSSRMLEFLAILVLLVPCTNLLFLGPLRIFWRSHPRRGLVRHVDKEALAYLFSIFLKGFHISRMEVPEARASARTSSQRALIPFLIHKRSGQQP